MGDSREKSFIMGDSRAMTIEFLRARLLSERSVSRTARQRADQLAKRVMELEQQLRIVTIQRKRAEKAAGKVLSILESQGIGDSSEMIDSSSDQEEVCHGPVRGEVTLNEEEISEGSRMGRSEVEDRLSGSELDVSSSQGKSLSWKSYCSNPDSHERERVKQIRERQRRSSFMPMVDSSSKKHIAKSCRKIRPGEMGSAAAEDEADKAVLGAHVNGKARLAGCSDDQPDVLRDASRNEAKEVFMNTSVQCSLDPSKESNAGLYDNGGDRDEEMEKVLEHQAQLIGQYQAEENAQREWEEKYGENQSSIMGLTGLGSEPGKAENNAEPRKEAVELTGENPYPEEAKSRTAMLSSSEELTAPSPLGAFVPDNQELYHTDQEKCGSSKEATASPNDIVLTNLTTNQNGSSYNPSSDGLLAGQFDMLDKGIKVSSHELVFSVKEGSERTANGKQNQFPFLESSDASSHGNAIRRPNVDGFPESPSIGTPSSTNSSARFSTWRSSNILLHRQLPQASSDRLGGVLEALQHAKTSLHQLNKAPSNQDTLAIAASSDSQLQGIHYDNMLGTPIGSAGLFRLPTGSFTQAKSSCQKLDASRLRLAAIRPDAEYETNGNDCHYPMTSCLEAGPRVSVGKQYFDPFITSGIGVSAPSMYSLRSSGIVRKRMPSHDGFASPYLDVRNEMPSEGRYMYDGHGTWPDMRRF